MSSVSIKFACKSFVFFLLFLLSTSCEDKDRPVIVCWGDSLTAPHISSNDLKNWVKEKIGYDQAYPEILQELVGDEYRVVNCGVGSERSLEIMARQGSLPIMLAHDVTVNDNDHAKYPIFIGNEDVPSLVTVWRDSIHDLHLLRRGWEVGSSSHVNPVLIDTISYTIKCDFHYWSGKPTVEPVTQFVDSGSVLHCESNTYLLPTKLPDNVTRLPKGTVISTDASRTLRNADINVFFAGANGGYASLDEFLEQTRMMIDYANSDNYYVLSFHVTNKVFDTFDKLAVMEDSLSMIFGDRYINVRRELGADANGPVPYSLLSPDKIHFNSNGHKRIAELIHSRISRKASETR